MVSMSGILNAAKEHMTLDQIKEARIQDGMEDWMLQGTWGVPCPQQHEEAQVYSAHGTALTTFTPSVQEGRANGREEQAEVDLRADVPDVLTAIVPSRCSCHGYMPSV